MPQIFLGFFVPFLGTCVGAAFVFFLKDKLSSKFEQILIGFAGGVMVAASIWSLLVPALEFSQKYNNLAILPATIGFSLGIVFLLVVDKISNNLENNSSTKQKVLSKRTSMMMLAITIHNIPEGMAVGVALAGAYYGQSSISILSALTLAIGIAIQNIPDGAIVSTPLYMDGYSKTKSFLFGVLSGLLELISGVVAFFLTSWLSIILPYVLAFAGGATLFVVVKNLMPSTQTEESNNLAAVSFAIGFLIMMILDVALG